MESFEEQWARVVAMTQNCPFITGKPVIHTSGSMCTVKEGFWRQHGVSIVSILLGLATLVPMMPDFRQDFNDGDINIYLILLLGVLCLYFGIVRILTVRRLCWNGNAAIIYLHYGWLWNRHIFQIPRESIHIKISVAGEKKLSSCFYHGNTILSLELKNRVPASGICLLADSSRDLMSLIARLLSGTHVNVEDSTMAQVRTEDGRTIGFPKTGIGSTNIQLPNMRLSLRESQGQVILGRTLYQMVFWMAFVVLGAVGLFVMARFIRPEWEAFFVGIGSLLVMVIGVIGWFPGFGITILVDSKKSDVIIHQGFLRTGPKKRIISFRQIIGVQVCPRHVEDEDKNTMFELNLVIQDAMDVERIHLLAETDDVKIISYAQQIAAAMNKPIFDHRMMKTFADTIIL